MTRPAIPRTPARARRGAALIIVLIMTFGLAGLAMSAIYLSAGSGALQRLYEREANFRYAAEAALMIGKSRANRDTLLTLSETGYTTLVSNGTLTDAQGATVPRVRVDLYGALTGDTMGRFGQFVTLVSRAYDAGGTRHVRRLDLTAESFSRYAMFTNTWTSGLAYGTGEVIDGRAHSNGNWASTGSPGPTYRDSVSAVGTISGSATFVSPAAAVASAARIPFPTVAKLAALPGYATTGNLNFTPVTGSSAVACSNSTNISGTTASGCSGNQARRGTRLEFVTFDADANGDTTESEGFLRLFDLAAGMDTTRLRVDLAGSPVAFANVILQTQCGGLYRIGGRDEFFPVATYNTLWVRQRIMASTNPVLVAADTAAMRNNSAAGVYRILSRARAQCFPAGSPYLMLTERLTADGSTCNATATTGTGQPYAFWGNPNCTAAASARYGGQDTTFTVSSQSCVIGTATSGSNMGRCTGASVALGSWRQAPTAIQQPTTAFAATVRQGTERTYVYPLAKPVNLNSRGVVHFTAGPVFVSGTLRGFVTVYVLGSVDFIDDLVYDRNPSVTLCRNFLGIIAEDSVMTTDNAVNRPRVLSDGGTNRTVWLGDDRDFILHGITMALDGTVAVENFGGGPASSAVIAAHGNSTNCPNNSGGCLAQVGGVIQQRIAATYSGSGTGLRETRTTDRCQLTNAKPPFFPVTGRYIENKYFEVDPNMADDSVAVGNLFEALRGRIVP